MKAIRIGRNQDNDIIIQNDPYVSRSHCILYMDDNGLRSVQDLNSTNGTYVNGIRVGVQTLLHAGDQVIVGNTIIPWESYLPNNKTIVKSASSQKEHEDVSSNYSPSIKESASSPYPILTLLSGLASFGIVVYIVINYFTSFGYQLLSAFGASTFKGFVVYLHGWFGIGGQWFLIITAIVIGGISDLFGSLDDSESSSAKSIGLTMGNIALTTGLIFLVLAVFAEKIVSA